MDKQTFTRNELYDLVWSEPMLTLSKKYNISDVGLRKMCVRMSIPLPKAGHWQKLQFGKKVSKPKLPGNYTGEKEVILSLLDENTTLLTPRESPYFLLKNQIENDKSFNLSVPEKLIHPDKLIVTAKESLTRKNSYERNGLVSCLSGELDIKVTKINIVRALLFMDALIKALRARGHVVFTEYDSTYTLINTQKLKIGLREKTKRVPGNDRWQTSEYHPTGQLIFKLDEISHYREWIDGKLALEDQLSSILAKLELASIRLNEQQLIWQKQREEREQQEKIKKAYEQKQQKELIDFKDMLLKASRWHKTVNLRNYIDSVEQKAAVAKGISDELRSWLDWAQKKADWYDPFIECEDDLLNEVDRETLTFKQKATYFFPAGSPAFLTLRTHCNLCYFPA